MLINSQGSEEGKKRVLNSTKCNGTFLVFSESARHQKNALRFHFTPVKIEDIKKKMLVRMLAKVNSYVLLMGMLTSQATVEISMEVIKKIK